MNNMLSLLDGFIINIFSVYFFFLFKNAIKLTEELSLVRLCEAVNFKINNKIITSNNINFNIYNII